MNNKLEVLTVGGGCFWCTEAVFQQIKGVEKVVSGYSGGTVPGRPTYREVCSGLTGHAEVIQVDFNPDIISYEELIVIFMTSHDPTSLNKQGADAGTEYRSVIFYHNNKQREIATIVAREITAYYEKDVVTEISPLGVFYAADKEHQDFYNQNSNLGYCNYVINPKLAKLRMMHADKLKEPV